ncbi:uncharacterized protein BDCG_01417 [Blastomyces dermatitidis ER-3]|uniref:Cytochrome P450 n=1 Tax=Ajellomyces dermatitidis (strain ER-3 / ATCC MYA-2586) TaxID=559297 RepID=A0ABP2ERJ7_AJEDR|nr:uncharacterized protein BDCG_01417 [Blastomyces dermatitidis ER-3]EEQ86297.1 hypothetical protein BDCG_01417 [Blastomyces dermatitidis ER-3]
MLSNIHFIAPVEMMLCLVFVLLISPFLLTWVFTSVKARCEFQQGREPPLIPYAIPWLGHGLFFRRGTTRFSSWVRGKYPSLPVSRTLMAGNYLYTVFDTKLASQIDRRPKLFTFDPIVLLVNKAFGAPQADLKILEKGPTGPNGAGDGQGLIPELHRQHIPGLSGINLPPMVSKFNEVLTASLEQAFSMKESHGNSGTWKTLDFNEFLMRHYTLASIPMIMGTRLMEVWPQAYEDLWEFDSWALALTTNLPGIFIPEAAASRSAMVSVLERWEEEATKHRKFEDVESEDPAWDEYWGARLMRQRHRTFLNNGISKRGRAVFHLSLMWATNANAIPAATWMLIHCVLDPQLYGRVRRAIALSQKQDGTLDIGTLATNKLIKSLVLEVLRLYVSSPSVRLVLETTELGGYVFRKGGTIFIPGRELQTDPDVWSPDGTFVDASEFWAERFIDKEPDDNENTGAEINADTKLENLGGQNVIIETGLTLSADAMSIPGKARSKPLRERMYSMRPFGGGTSFCPGRNLAMYEVVVGMVAILSAFDIEVDKEALASNGMPQPNTNLSGTMGPDRPFMVRMKKRETAE